MELKPVGYKYVEFPDHNEIISVKRPNNSANNLVVGTLYLDTHGDLILNNMKTKEQAKVYFTRMGWTKSSYYKIEGNIYDQYGVA